MEVKVLTENFKILSIGLADIAEQHKIPHEEFVGCLMELVYFITNGSKIILKVDGKTFVFKEESE